MGTKSAAGLLTSVDSMFTTQEERDNAQRSYVTDLPTAEISDFPDHPFKVRMDESMTELADSVRERGILHPVLVRPMPDGGYQMVAGHRRKMAAELAGLPTVPCIVRELTDDEAVIIMVDSNLQRDQVLPSEKAFAYKMKLDAMNRQGQRTDLTCAPMAHKLKGIKSRDMGVRSVKQGTMWFWALPDEDGGGMPPGRESRGKPSGPPPCWQGVVGYTTLAPAAAVVARAGASGAATAGYRHGP